MQKVLTTPVMILLVVLGGITVSSVLAQSVTITYPYILTDGTNQRFIIASSGNVGIGNTGLNPPGLFNVRQYADNALGGLVFQNANATGSMRLWMDSSNNGHISGSGGIDKIVISPSGIIELLNGNVGVGTSTPSQKLDVIGSEHLTGNMTVTPTNEFKISTTNSKDICIGSC